MKNFLLLLLPLIFIAGCWNWSWNINDHPECQEMLSKMEFWERLWGSYTYKMAFYSKTYQECFYAYSWESDDWTIKTYWLSSFSSPKLLSIMEAWENIFMMDEYKWNKWETIEKKDGKWWYELRLDSIEEYKK